MSHRVTVQTEIKDRSLAEAALKQAGCTFVAEGRGIRITGGTVLRRAFIDLSSGLIEADSDDHRAAALDGIKAFYVEAKLKHDLMIRGGTINSRTETADRIVLIVQQSEAQMG